MNIKEEITMNIYDRIINILLEARIEDYLNRLDEASPMSRGDRADKVSSKQVGAQPERVKQLSKRDPVTKALGTVDKSKSAKKPHRVFTGRRMKTSSHITTPTSKLKRAVQTVIKHG